MAISPATKDILSAVKTGMATLSTYFAGANGNVYQGMRSYDSTDSFRDGKWHMLIDLGSSNNHHGISVDLEVLKSMSAASVSSELDLSSWYDMIDAVLDYITTNFAVEQHAVSFTKPTTVDGEPGGNMGAGLWGVQFKFFVSRGVDLGR